MRFSSAFFVSFIIALTITASIVGFFQPIRPVLLLMSAPPVGGMETLLGMLRSSWDIIGIGTRTEVRDAINTIGELEAARAEQEAIIRQYESAHATFRELPGIAERTIPARVITRVLDAYSNTILTDKGETDGVRPDARVFVGSNLVGVVSSVSSHASTVEFLTAPQRESTGLISNLGVEAHLIGEGVGIFQARVPRELVPEKDMIIVNNAAENYVIGRISSVSVGQASPFLELVVKSLVNQQTIQIVYIER